MLKKAKNFALLLLGVLLMAFALHSFFEPFSIITGGATGLAIIADKLFGVPLWLSNLVINAPLFVWAYFVFDRSFIVRSGLATAALSLFLFMLEDLPIIENDYVTVSAIGSLLYGCGIGLVLRQNATTGGSDLAAGIIHRLRGDISVSQAMFCIDVAIIMLGFSIFGAIKAMYGIISVFVITKAIDFVLEGLNFAKAAFIVCDRGDVLGKAIMQGIDRGVTVLPANGMYTGNQKQVLMVAVSRKQLTALKAITAEVEPSAFMFVTDIREILGEF